MRQVRHSVSSGRVVLKVVPRTSELEIISDQERVQPSKLVYSTYALKHHVLWLARYPDPLDLLLRQPMFLSRLEHDASLLTNARLPDLVN